jgi:MoxR-like ATPase
MYNLLLVKLNKTGDITMNQRDFLSHNQVVSLIKAVGDKRTVLIMGENGIGKTSVHRTLCADPDFSTHFKVPPIDCTQLSDGSLFMPDIDRERGVSRELPNERLGISFNNQRGSMNQQPVMLFFDEVAKVPQFVKNMIAPVAYERRAGSMFMPDKSVVIMATNLAMEGLGDYLEAHLRNRIIVVYMRKPSLDEFMNDFAIPNKLNPILLACLEEHQHGINSPRSSGSAL